MGKIQASLADVSTDFEPLPPAVYDFEIEKVEEDYKDGNKSVVKGYRIRNKVVSPDQHGRVFGDYVAILKKNGEQNDIGLASLKRYFEVTHGIEEVSGPKDPTTGQRSGGWTDDEFDTDRLIGKRWKGQLEISSHTPEGATEPRRNNKVKAMESYS